MESASYAIFLAAIASTALAAVARVAALVPSRGRGARTATAPAAALDDPPASPADVAEPLTALGFALLTASLVTRAIATGHGPFSNQYEFSIAFAWGIIAAALIFERRYRLSALGALVVPVALALLLYAATLPSSARPLVPALQNNLLLSLHVAAAILAYGTFTIGFAAALLYLLRTRLGAADPSASALLDEIGYRATAVGFPLMALVIILGAYWANVAWGRYWSWDPKETASLVTWLIYGAYLHARGVRGWRGRRAATLLVVGFLATVFTFLGNTFFGGLHSYAGLG